MRRARRYARKNRLEFSFDPTAGKGSHGTVYVGRYFTTVQHGEIIRSTLFNMLKDLNIHRGEF